MKWWEEINQYKSSIIRGTLTELIEIYIEYGRGNKEAKEKEIEVFNKYKISNEDARIQLVKRAEQLYNKIQLINAGCI
jgi:methionyl-tRNA formyltransferase